LQHFQYVAVGPWPIRPKPKLIATFNTGLGRWSSLPQNAHGLSISEDGNRAYFVTAVYSSFVGPGLTWATPNVVQNNGLIIADVSEIQARKPNPQVRIVSKFVVERRRQVGTAHHQT